MLLAAQGKAAVCVPVPAGIVGWWPGEGNGNDVASTNNGTLQGGATATGTGAVGSCFTFDGTNGYVQIPNSPVLCPSNLTIEAWVRFDALDTPALGGARIGEEYIVFKQNSRTNTFEGYFLGKGRIGTRDCFVFGVSSASGQAAELDSGATVTTNVWYHVAGTRGSNYIQLYVNGQLDSQTNADFPQDYGNYPLYFGASGQPYWDRKLCGALDEVSLYNRALSATDIAAIYAAGKAGKCPSPRIVVQPQDQTAYWGGAVAMAATASGANPLSCQWLKDGQPLAGATSCPLLLTNVQLTNGGSYRLVATNLYGSATSSTAVLRLKVADLSAALSPPGSQSAAALTIAGVPNQTYGLQVSSNMGQSVVWSGLTNVFLTNSPGVWYDPAPATNARKFYRVLPGPIAVP
jgi:hypothetical protein